METLIDDISKMFSCLFVAFAIYSIIFAIEIDRLKQRVSDLEAKLSEQGDIDNGNDDR